MRPVLQVAGAVEALASPFEAWAYQGLSIAEIVALAPCRIPEEFWDLGEVRINDVPVKNEYWHVVRPKPPTDDLPIVITLHPPALQGGGGGGGTKNIIRIAATIAVIAGAAAISGGALAGPAASLGFAAGTFAAGSTSAVAAAAAFGAVGQLAIAALIPPPVAQNTKAQDQRETSPAGITGNSVVINGYLPGILGEMVFSPPYIAKPYSYRKDKQTVVEGLFGIGNRCQITDVMFNEAPAADFADSVDYEIREGLPGQARFENFATNTVSELQLNSQLSNFVLKSRDAGADQLVHQLNPVQDLPQPAIYRSTWPDFDEMRFRLNFPGGMVNNDPDSGAERAAVPIRLRARPLGGAWVNLPSFFVQDLNKGAGPVEAQVILRRGYAPALDPASENAYFTDDELDVFVAYYTEGRGETFEYNAHAAFSSENIVPDMTSGSTGGVTITHSSASPGFEAWRAFDNSREPFGGSNWLTVAGITAATVNIDLGVQKTWRWFRGIPDTSNPTRAMTNYRLYTSNDGVGYTMIYEYLGGAAISNFAIDLGIQKCRYIRIEVLAVNGSNRCQMTSFVFAKGIAATYDSGTFGPLDTNPIFPSQVMLTPDGIEIWLDPDHFPANTYFDIEVKRGQAFTWTDFNKNAFTYFGNGFRADWFGTYLDAGVHKVRNKQLTYATITLLSVFQTWKYAYPLNVDDLPFPQIAIKGRDVEIKSVAATFTSVAPIWDGNTWSNDAPTNNNGALFRLVAFQEGREWAVPGEVLDDPNLISFYETCVANGYEVNAVVDQEKAMSILQMIASAGQAVPRYHEKVGVVIDRDTSNEAPRQIFTPKNIRNWSMKKSYSRLPHAIIAQFRDASQAYAERNVIAYAPGYAQATATDFEVIEYPGFTDEAKVLAKATYDIRQMWYRPERWIFEAPAQSVKCDKGDLVGMTHYLLDSWQQYSNSVEVTIEGGLVTSIELEDFVDLSKAAGDLGGVDDVGDLGDLGDVNPGYAAMLQLSDSTTITHPIIETGVTRRITFVTPFAAPDRLDPGLTVTLGPGGRQTRRVRVLEVEPVSEWIRRLTVLAEAPEIFA